MKTKLPAIQLVILCLLILVLLGLFFTTENKILQVNKLQLEVTQQESNIKKLDELSATLPGMSSEIAGFLNTLPANEEDVADFATTLEQVAKGAGITIAFHFDDFPKPVEVIGQNITGLGSEIALEGSFQGVTTFLTKLSNLQYFFKIDKLTIIKLETKPGVKAIITGALMMNIEKK